MSLRYASGGYHIDVGIQCTDPTCTRPNVAKAHNSPDRVQTNSERCLGTFQRKRSESIAATDFFTVEVLTLHGLVTYYILFVIDLASRTVKIAGITSRTHEVWIMQMVRNLTDADEPFFRHTRFLIMDRDTKYSAAFRAALARERIEPIRLPPRSPNLNAFAERFVRSMRSECLNRMIFFGQDSLQHAISQFMAHYHAE
jgi:putative transposase